MTEKKPMNREEQYRKHQAYIKAEGLDSLIDFQEHASYHERVFDTVSGTLKISFPPEPADLVRLHKLIRQRKCFTVLEFGLGYSTIIMADALAKNQRDWELQEQAPEVRNRFMFQLFSVDPSRDWIKRTKTRFPKHLIDHVHFQHSPVTIGTFNGQLCHYFKKIPDIVPDFIYLDGPHSKDVKGHINGLSFQCDERTVMSADLLLMEPTLLPGTFIAVDGRTNNARFLQRNFSRQYEMTWDRAGDTTSFELIEEGLGKHNSFGSVFFCSSEPKKTKKS